MKEEMVVNPLDNHKTTAQVETCLLLSCATTAFRFNSAANRVQISVMTIVYKGRCHRLNVVIHSDLKNLCQRVTIVLLKRQLGHISK